MQGNGESKPDATGTLRVALEARRPLRRASASHARWCRSLLAPDHSLQRIGMDASDARAHLRPFFTTKEIGRGTGTRSVAGINAIAQPTRAGRNRRPERPTRPGSHVIIYWRAPEERARRLREAAACRRLAATASG